MGPAGWLARWLACWLAVRRCPSRRRSDPPLAIRRQAHACGDTKHGLGHTPLLFYPRLAQDAFALYQDGSASPACRDTAAGCFYGVCVAACPEIGDIVCTYEVEVMLASEFPAAAAQPGSEDAVRLSLARQRLANERLGCWVSQMQQVELLSRCLPYTQEVQTTEYWCANTPAATHGGAPRPYVPW